MNKPRALYYICHLDNLESIVKNGLLSRAKMQKKPHKDIHDTEILDRRNKPLPNGKNLQQHVNLYFCPRNAMLYRLRCNFDINDLVILEIKPTILNMSGWFFSDRNSATDAVNFYNDIADLKKLDGKIFKKEYWTDSDDTKQRMMAEVLIPDHIPAEYISSIILPNSKTRQKIKSFVGNINCFSESSMFFFPKWGVQLNKKISLSMGDMFFSAMQTFTISVNLKGVMGKGLASRTKYQFPDAYVRYQDDCKSNKLKVGKPTLFKRAIRIEEELADDSTQINSDKLNGNRWFLFFPTKRHWRDGSRLEDIELAMQWLLKNYQKQEIESLALPALGCGLGGLQWQQVGPLMCHYLNQMKIKSCVYLPMENNIDARFLEAEYLLRSYQPNKSNNNLLG